MQTPSSHPPPAQPGALDRDAQLLVPLDVPFERAPRPVFTNPCLVHLRALADAYDIARWAARYLRERVLGMSPLTLQAKARDLELFVVDFTQHQGLTELRQWGVAQTQTFLWRMRQEGRAPATLNRQLATLRHFARWLQTLPDSPTFSRTLPTEGVQSIRLEEPGCKKLSDDELTALFAAADRVVHRPDNVQRLRPRRDRALLGVLLHTGLRINELLSLKLAQYKGDRLEAVERKGGGRTASVYLTASSRAWIEDYLQVERQGPDGAMPLGDAPLFATPTGARLERASVARVFDRLARVASVGRAQPITFHPHMLRHTFGAAYRAKSGSDTETAAALGHTGLRYVGRYVRRTDAERAETMESLFGSPSAPSGFAP